MADATSPPKIGSPAPAFSLPAPSGRAVSLREYLGRKIVLVYFYPKDDTPGCTKEACSLRDGWRELRRRGIEVLGISRDDAASHKAFAAKYDLPFELLTDSDHRVHEAYGAWGQSAWGVGPLRKSFLIGKDGRVLHVFEKVDTEHHAEEVLKAMESSVPPGSSQPPAPEPKPAAPTVSEAVEKAAQAVQTAVSVATHDAKKAVEKAAVAVGQKAASVRKAVKKAAKKAARKVAKKVAKKAAPKKKKRAVKKAVRRKAVKKVIRKRAVKRAVRKAVKKAARRKAAPKRKTAKRKKR